MEVVVANRLTDTEKWKDSWFRKLPGNLKLLYLFMVDTCDCAGIWQDQLADFNFQTGFNITHDEMERYFDTKLIKISEEAYLIPRFVIFQQKGQFNPDRNKAHLGIKRRLDHYGISFNKLVDLAENKENDASALKGLQRGIGIGIGIGIGKDIGIGIGMGTGKGIGKGTGIEEGIGKEHEYKNSLVNEKPRHTFIIPDFN
jgi:hypothetical protein